MEPNGTEMVSQGKNGSQDKSGVAGQKWCRKTKWYRGQKFLV
jgi:hypothetical protein